MEVLVSVVNEEQAEQAANSGATWVDLKDPRRGPLGWVEDGMQQAFLQRMSAWPHVRRSVALGELAQHAGTLPIPLPGFQFAKLGTSNLATRVAEATGPAAWWPRWLEWRDRLPPGCSAVLVAYADADRCAGLSIAHALELADRFHLPYLLIDTYDKSGGGLLTTLDRQGLRDQVPQWIQSGRRQGTCLAWAGQLDRDDLRQLRAWQAQIAGVRSAICQRRADGLPDRLGGLCPERLRQILLIGNRLADPHLMGRQDLSLGPAARG